MPESQVRQINIMISSTRADLAQYREEASRVIRNVASEKEKQLQLIERSMEKETQSGDREFAVAVSKRWVEESDWVVVIVGWHYGTISNEPGADDLSVTEWEYTHACHSNKKLFVFIAGEPATANQYRVSEEEREDLKDWKDKQTSEQKDKLKKFKEKLNGHHVEMFKNLPAFRERLEKTLKDAIDNLPPEIQPGTPLADLIVTVTPSIRDCIQKVKSIAKCKRIHDHLHELRQHVIRPLREEVLSVWKEGRSLSGPRKKVIWRCMFKRSEVVGGLKEVRLSIGPDHEGLRDSVDAVLQRPAPWDIESDSSQAPPSREEFSEVVDEFAIAVQEAFSEADRSMDREEGNLRERYPILLEDLKRARQQQKLSSSDQQRLDDELKNVDDNRSHVKKFLTSHHAWQEAHDKLEELDSFREGNEFERKLKHYRGTPLAKLLRLVEEELKELASNSVTEAAVIVAASQGAPLQESNLQSRSDIFALNLKQLKESLESLCQGAGADVYDNVRKFFDDAFYYIDKRTLSEVERAHERAVELLKWLDKLANSTKENVLIR